MARCRSRQLTSCPSTARTRLAAITPTCADVPVPSSQEVKVVTIFAAAAASWGVAMALAPLLQIHTIRRSRSSANVSIAYQQVLLVGFVLWLAYGIEAGNLALIVPNAVAVVVCASTVVVSLRYR